jgi:hypothetical protein
MALEWHWADFGWRIHRRTPATRWQRDDFCIYRQSKRKNFNPLRKSRIVIRRCYSCLYGMREEYRAKISFFRRFLRGVQPEAWQG